MIPRWMQLFTFGLSIANLARDNRPWWAGLLNIASLAYFAWLLTTPSPQSPRARAEERAQ